jgi:hypothetical protein
MGDKFTVAHAYHFTITNWTILAAIDLTPWPNLKSFNGPGRGAAKGQGGAQSRGAAQGGLTAAFGANALRTGVHAGGTTFAHAHVGGAMPHRRYGDQNIVRSRIGRSRFRSG